ncbi:hypothetical protein [Pseudomonas sp. REB1044]|uniref:hypothetical protein n=1 Tax=Pseudomonas sp. REB1044 TaxID=2675224 RepID=UPI00315D071C
MDRPAGWRDGQRALVQVGFIGVGDARAIGKLVGTGRQPPRLVVEACAATTDLDRDLASQTVERLATDNPADDFMAMTFVRG